MKKIFALLTVVLGYFPLYAEEPVALPTSAAAGEQSVSAAPADQEGAERDPAALKDRRRVQGGPSGGAAAVPPANPPPKMATESTDYPVQVYLSPLLIVGLIDGGVEMRVADQFSIGPEGAFWNVRLGGYKITAWSLGVRGAYYFRSNAISEGPYIFGRFGYADVKVIEEDATQGDLEGTANGVALGGGAGYQWIWSNGISFRAGGGFGLSQVSNIKVRNKSTGYERDYGNQGLGGSVILEVDFGYAF